MGQGDGCGRKLHGRGNPVSSDYDDRRLPCAIALLFPSGNEHVRAGLQIGLAARDKVYNFRILWDDNGLLTVLIFNREVFPSTFSTC